jgi:hypothetical protein
VYLINYYKVRDLSTIKRKFLKFGEFHFLLSPPRDKVQQDKKMSKGLPTTTTTTTTTTGEALDELLAERYDLPSEETEEEGDMDFNKETFGSGPLPGGLGSLLVNMNGCEY